jgi:oligoribonuclease (3'-5' exoribonuclease)
MSFLSKVEAVEKKDYGLPKELVMIDCEMTGVNPDVHDLLQVAALKLKLDDGQYTTTGEPFMFYLHSDETPQNDFQKRYLAPVYEKCNKSTKTSEDLKSELHDWLGELKGKVMPVGDCVPTDITFLYTSKGGDRPDIKDDGQPIEGTFHYEFFEMNPLKMLAEEITGAKLKVDGLDDDNIHDALVDCKNQLIELNYCLKVLRG